jgi:hypothetical protein
MCENAEGASLYSTGGCRYYELLWITEWMET